VELGRKERRVCAANAENDQCADIAEDSRADTRRDLVGYVRW
jgi:hypothetical protein